jgi:hypothetical protein
MNVNVRERSKNHVQTTKKKDQQSNGFTFPKKKQSDSDIHLLNFLSFSNSRQDLLFRTQF